MFEILIFYKFLIDRAVTESINQLINVCTVSAPGQKECDNALRQIQVSSGGNIPMCKPHHVKAILLIL